MTAAKAEDPSAELLRLAMQKVAAAIVIVTTSGRDRDFGQTLTATSMALASTEPTQVMISLNAKALLLQKIREAGCFSLNYAADDQHEIVRDFLDPAQPQAEAFANPRHWRRLESGAPILIEAVAAIDCELTHESDQGNHVVLTGTLKGLIATDKSSLLYRDGLLRRLDSHF